MYTVYKVCFFSGASYFEQFFPAQELAEQAAANFNGIAVIEKHRV